MRSAGFGGEVRFVETSPILREAQRAAVGDAHWLDSVDDLPQEPQLIVANEFLDALPVQQFVQGTERRVTIVGGGLTLRSRKDSKHIDPSLQIRAKKADRVRIVKMKPEVEATRPSDTDVVAVGDRR